MTRSGSRRFSRALIASQQIKIGKSRLAVCYGSITVLLRFGYVFVVPGSVFLRIKTAEGLNVLRKPERSGTGIIPGPGTFRRHTKQKKQNKKKKGCKVFPKRETKEK